MCDKVRGMYEKGFGEFYSVTHDALYRYIWGKMGTDVMIEDIMQETYYKAYENREMLESHPNVVGWLFKTANFIVRNQKRKKDNQSVSLEKISETARNLYSYGGYETIEWKMMLEDMLSDKEKELIYLYYQSGYSSAEIARRNGATEGNIRVKLYRVRRKIREQMRGGDCAETRESYY